MKHLQAKADALIPLTERIAAELETAAACDTASEFRGRIGNVETLCRALHGKAAEIVMGASVLEEKS